MLQTIKKVGLRWLLRFCKLDMSSKDQRQALVDTFINAIYLYDDKVLITFNYKEGTQTVTFGEATEVASEGNGSDLDCIPAPQERQLLVAVFFLFYAAVSLQQHRPRCRALRPICTEPLKSFSALDNHPLFAVY